MAWSYRSKRTYSRSARRSFRRRRLARPRYRRRYRRRYGARKSTKSAVVKLSLTANYSNYLDNDGKWAPFFFYPGALNGFQDYATTYSHFRLLKGRLHINRDVEGASNVVDTNYLVAGSRPFAASAPPISMSSGTLPEDWAKYVPPQTEAALRQSKWQKVIYPNSTRTQITVGFYPYTMVGTFGPPHGDDGGYQWQRIWEGRRWMPFTWSAIGSQRLLFFGPYIASFQNTGGTIVATGFRITLELHCQFKGQK